MWPRGGIPRAQTRPRSNFAEVAEALSIPTTQIIGTSPGEDGKIYVLYSDPWDGNPEELPGVHGVLLGRAADGILRPLSLAVEIDNYWGDLKSMVVKALEAEREPESDG